jgi:hypothetical protein
MNNFLYLFHYILYIYFCTISTHISFLILDTANVLVLIYLLFDAFFSSFSSPWDDKFNALIGLSLILDAIF